MKYRVAESASIICFCLCFAVSCQRDPQPTPSTPPPPALAKGLQLLPIDEASKDSSFLKFREELLQAVERRDATYVLGILDPHIKNNFGGDGGIDEFRETWKPEQADSELWKELRFVLTHEQAVNVVGVIHRRNFPALEGFRNRFQAFLTQGFVGRVLENQ